MERLALGLAVCAVLSGLGCDSVSPESIATWKTTERGPGRLKEALASDKVPPKLRALAAFALLDIGSYEDAERGIAAMDGAARIEMLKSLVPLYVAGIQDASAAKARDARDGLFSVRGYLAPEDQKATDAVLMASLEKDLRAGQPGGGRHGMDKIFGAIGVPTGPLLVTLLAVPATPYEAIVDTLVKVADPATRARGGAAMLKRARTMPGALPVAVWRALGTLGGDEATAFLVGKIKQGPPDQALRATQALQQSRNPALLPTALELAGDAKVDKGVRDELFGLLELIGGVAARDGLVRIIAADKDPMVRYRAYEAALVAGKESAVVPALEAFAGQATYKKEDVVDFLVKDIQKIGTKAHAALLVAIESPSPLARMTGVLALESMGNAQDAAQLSRRSDDKGLVKGFPTTQSVGKESARVAAVLKNKAAGATP